MCIKKQLKTCLNWQRELNRKHIRIYFFVLYLREIQSQHIYVLNVIYPVHTTGYDMVNILKLKREHYSSLTLQSGSWLNGIHGNIERISDLLMYVPVQGIKLVEHCRLYRFPLSLLYCKYCVIDLFDTSFFVSRMHLWINKFTLNRANMKQNEEKKRKGNKRKKKSNSR